VRGVAALPVVDRKTQKLEGLITRGHVMTVYERRVAAGATPGDGRRRQAGSWRSERNSVSTD
jgi:hypothetical protein